MPCDRPRRQPRPRGQSVEVDCRPGRFGGRRFFAASTFQKVIYIKPVNLPEQMTRLARQAKAASRELARLTTAEKNSCLLAMAGALEQNGAAIKAANAEDLEFAASHGLSNAMLDRLRLDDHYAPEHSKAVSSLRFATAVQNGGLFTHCPQAIEIPSRCCGSVFLGAGWRLRFPGFYFLKVHLYWGCEFA